MEDTHLVKEKNECQNDVKYLKRQAVLDLCRKYGVLNKLDTLLSHFKFTPLPFTIISH